MRFSDTQCSTDPFDRVAQPARKSLCHLAPGKTISQEFDNDFSIRVPRQNLVISQPKLGLLAQAFISFFLPGRSPSANIKDFKRNILN
jgi:hypothetical protein